MGRKKPKDGELVGWERKKENMKRGVEKRKDERRITAGEGKKAEKRLKTARDLPWRFPTSSNPDVTLPYPTREVVMQRPSEPHPLSQYAQCKAIGINLTPNTHAPTPNVHVPA